MAHKVSFTVFNPADIKTFILLQDIRCMFVYTIKVICELPLIEETSKAIPKERQVMDHGAGNMEGVIEKRQELTFRKGRNF